MKSYITLLIILISTTCNKQKTKQKSTTKITTEKFDIETFEENQVNGKYKFILENGAKIEQEIDGEFYNSTYTPNPPEMFVIDKRFYKSGFIHSELVHFPNRFLKSKKTYNEKGELKEEINYDKNYKFTFEQLIALLEQEKDTIDLFDENTLIVRGVITEGAFWEIEYKKTFGRRETMIISGKSGEILERSFYKHEDN